MKLLILNNIVYNKKLIKWDWSKNCLLISAGLKMQIIKIDKKNFYNINNNVFILKHLSLKVFKKFILSSILGLLFGWLNILYINRISLWTSFFKKTKLFEIKFRISLQNFFNITTIYSNLWRAQAFLLIWK